MIHLGARISRLKVLWLPGIAVILVVGCYSLFANRSRLSERTCDCDNRVFSSGTVVPPKMSPALDRASNSSGYQIPNVYHFVRFNQANMKFVEMLAVASALKMNPTMVIIHCNRFPRGKMWDLISSDKRIVLLHRDPPADIYGKKPKWIQHASDLARIHILQQHGGIYLDNDCIMLRAVNSLRKHRCVVAKSISEKHMGNMFLMAAVGCPFLDLYEDLYRTQYQPDEWYYNAGELPTTAILNKNPEIAFLVDEGIQQALVQRLYQRDEPPEVLMGEYDMIHTLYNHKHYMVDDKTDYDLSNIYQINNTFTRIARWLLSEVNGTSSASQEDDTDE